MDLETEEFDTISTVKMTEYYFEDDETDLQKKDGGIDAAVAAFAELEGIPEGGRAARAPIPKAMENFPFGAKERPFRKKTDIKALFKSVAGNKAAWTNIGPVLILVLLICSMLFVMAEKPYIMLLDGKPIAYVKHKEDGQKLLEQINLEMSAPYPAEANFRQYAVIDYTKDGVEIKTKPTDDRVIIEALRKNISWFIDAWAISVGNERATYLATKAMAEEVLENVKKSYLPEGDELTIIGTEFVEPVELIKEEIPISGLGDPDQAFRTLTEGREPLREYTVQRGDSYWSIAERNNMTVEELKLINGAVSNNLTIGQVLKLNTPKPLLSVRTMVSAIRQEDIPYGTVYHPNNTILEGSSQVVKNGIEGVLEVSYEIAQINGVAVAQKVLSETVITEPVDEVVDRGTKAIVASRNGASGEKSGALSWPIRGRINSPFGSRSRGVHSGVDIQADTGDPVYSAGAGTVISASSFAGYGNQVTIDHGGGLTTMYAHLSEISVSVGQAVGLQELVGLAGTTGRTTGPHLHFEVRIDGSPVNPVNYLK